MHGADAGFAVLGVDAVRDEGGDELENENGIWLSNGLKYGCYDVQEFHHT